jgi:sodium/proline symporter
MEFFERRLGDKSGVLATIAGFVIVVFMTVNSSAEVIGSGKLMGAAFGVSYRSGMYIGIAIALVYTFLGGFLAVSWSNLVQGTLMIIALVLVPAAALSRVGGGSGLATSLLSQDKNLLSLFSGVTGFWPIVALITGGLGVGICYPGQPHVITTYMGIKDPKEVKASTVIAMIWVGVTCYGAVIIGMMGRSMFPTIEDPEQTFLLLAKTLFSAKMIGFFAAAVMSALLSSLSAYLLTAAASFASGTYRRLAKVTDDRKLVVVQRVAIVVIAAIAMLLSLQGGLVYKIALFATAGLGACFAPLVLFSLYSSRVNTKGAIWSMVVGMATVLLWWTLGLSKYVYEAVPGLIASTITLLVVSKLTGGPDKSVKETFLDFVSKDSHRKSLHVVGETRVNQ